MGPLWKYRISQGDTSGNGGATVDEGICLQDGYCRSCFAVADISSLSHRRANARIVPLSFCTVEAVKQRITRTKKTGIIPDLLKAYNSCSPAKFDGGHPA